MRFPYRGAAIGAVLLVFSVVLLGRAQAGGGHYYPPVSDPLVKEECGSCHLAFAPAMLPARSWARMMDGLQNHFGDDASLDAASAARIRNYLVVNAADTGGVRYGRKLARDLAGVQAPLRITELPAWQREHREVPAWEWRHPDVRTPANCVACHSGAERGYYED